MTVRGIEAIKLYIPPTNEKIDINIKEERATEVEIASNISDGVCDGDGDCDSINGSNRTMTSVERYRQEWAQLLSDIKESPERIRDLAFNGDLKVSKFRSIYWALLLRVLSDDHRTWCEQREIQRKGFEKLKQDFAKNPYEVKLPDGDDPLSQSPKSAWNQYFSDQELFGVIRQDVVRTFPGVDFFRKPIIQDAMCNILFYYAREHPYICYRQGMHEIVAPILFVMYGDHQALLHYKEIVKTDIDETLLYVLNPDYLEADSYSIFSRLMSSIETYYRISNLGQMSSGYIPPQEAASSPGLAETADVGVIGHLNFIRDNILAKEDLHLHNYLLKLDIPLHIFGIRWLRLLFGREFPLLDLLILWDSIFADSDRFDLPNYILVAMLVHIRHKLLLSDYTTCLTYLMRFPNNVDINLILHHALHMLQPKKYECPPNAFVYFTMNNTEGPQYKRNRSLSSVSSVSSNTASSKQNVNNSSSSTSRQQLSDHSPGNHAQIIQRSRSTSLSDAARMEKHINLLQERNAAQSAVLARIKANGNDNESIVMDGYSANSPELMRLELKNAQTIINIARNKLQTYLATMRQHVGRHYSEEMASSLDGIDEVCSLLDVKLMFPLHARSTPIDQALEANEQQQREMRTAKGAQQRKKSMGNGGLMQAKATSKVITDQPTCSAEAAAAGMGGNNTAYERPDNGFMLYSSRVLGNLREIELVPIATDEKVEKPLDHADEGSNAKETFKVIKNDRMPVSDPLGKNMTD